MPARNHKGEGSSTGGTGFEEKSRYEASSFASSVAEKTKEVASSIGEKVEGAAGAVGSTLENFGSAIRQREPASGMLHDAGEAIAARLEGTGRYLEQQGLSGIGEDVTNLIR